MKTCTFCLGPRNTDRWLVALRPFDRVKPLRPCAAFLYFCTRACMRWWLRRYVA